MDDSTTVGDTCTWRVKQTDQSINNSCNLCRYIWVKSPIFFLVSQSDNVRNELGCTIFGKEDAAEVHCLSRHRLKWRESPTNTELLGQGRRRQCCSRDNQPATLCRVAFEREPACCHRQCWSRDKTCTVSILDRDLTNPDQPSGQTPLAPTFCSVQAVISMMDISLVISKLK